MYLHQSSTKLLLTVYLISAYFESSNCVNGHRVKLADIQILTFFKDRFTTGRRLSPVAQLQCDSKLRLLSYSNCYKFKPKVVQCYNRGHDGETVQWECKADLDKHVKFSALKVSCEGYDYTDDSYVLFGSCGLEYSLETRPSKNFNEYYHRDVYETNKLSNLLTLLIVMIIMVAIYKSCSKQRSESTDRRPDINETFAQVINGTNETRLNLNIVGALFPAPPPPYGLISNSTNNTSTNTANGTDDNNNTLKPECSTPGSNNTLLPHVNGLNRALDTEVVLRPLTGFNNSEFDGFNACSTSEWSGATRSESPPPAYEVTDPVVTDVLPK